MKMFLLSGDEDTLTGLRLAGIGGALVQSENEFDLWCEKLKADSETGILLVTSTLAALYGEKMSELKKNSDLIVTQVPDVHSRQTDSEHITRYIRESIGIKV